MTQQLRGAAMGVLLVRKALGDFGVFNAFIGLPTGA